jgi:hypothetical protein
MSGARITLAGLALLVTLLALRFEASALPSFAAFTDNSTTSAEVTAAWQTETLTAPRDAWTDGTTGNEATNFGSDTTMLVEGPDRQGWLAFDLSSIPAGAIVFSARLRLCDTGSVGTALDHSLELAGATWVEGTITANNAPGVLTDPPALTLALTETTGPTCFFADVLPHVQAWLAATDPVANHGWRLTATTDSVPVAYATKEGGDLAEEPQLVIGYVEP